MRTATSIALLLIVLLPNIAKVAIIVDFKVNQDFIAEVFCINKDEPITICGGKCYLNKQLKKADEAEHRDVPGALKQKTETLLFFQSLTEQVNSIDVLENTSRAFFDRQQIYHSSYLNRLFRPPELPCA